MNQHIYKIKIDRSNWIIWKKKMSMDLQGKMHKINLRQICGIWDHPIYLCNYVVASTCTLTAQFAFHLIHTGTYNQCPIKVQVEQLKTYMYA